MVPLRCRAGGSWIDAGGLPNRWGGATAAAPTITTMAAVVAIVLLWWEHGIIHPADICMERFLWVQTSWNLRQTIRSSLIIRLSNGRLMARNCKYRVRKQTPGTAVATIPLRETRSPLRKQALRGIVQRCTECIPSSSADMTISGGTASLKGTATTKAKYTSSPNVYVVIKVGSGLNAKQYWYQLKPAP